MYTMSEDAKAILMLCGHLGGPSEVEPLELRDYNQVARWLRDAHLRPADLLAMTHVPALAQGTGIAADRLAALLKRGVKLGFAVELGAVAFSPTTGPEGPAVLLAKAAAAKALPSGEDDLPLFGAALGGPRSTAAETAMVHEPAPPSYGPPVTGPKDGGRDAFHSGRRML